MASIIRVSSFEIEFFLGRMSNQFGGFVKKSINLLAVPEADFVLQINH